MHLCQIPSLALWYSVSCIRQKFWLRAASLFFSSVRIRDGGNVVLGNVLISVSHLSSCGALDCTGVLGFNVEDCPVGEIVVAIYRVRPVFYPVEIICDGMLRTRPVLDVEVKFLQEQHPLSQFPY